MTTRGSVGSVTLTTPPGTQEVERRFDLLSRVVGLLGKDVPIEALTDVVEWLEAAAPKPGVLYMPRVEFETELSPDASSLLFTGTATPPSYDDVPGRGRHAAKPYVCSCGAKYENPTFLEHHIEALFPSEEGAHIDMTDGVMAESSNTERKDDKS
jgi:hypothetical protein